MIGIVDYYLIPLALLLGLNAEQIGWLVAIPNLVSSFSQLFAVPVVRWAGDRMRLLLIGVAIQILFLIPLALVSITRVSHALVWLTVLVTVYKTVGGLVGPAWGSLVSEYLPAHRRGHYFGWRARILSVAGMANLAFWGFFLYLFKKEGRTTTGFFLLFIAASLARVASWTLLSRMTNLPWKPTSESEFTFWMFLRRFRESNFVKFVFYVAAVTFATNLAAPYFSVYMLNTLKFNYLVYTAINFASVLTGLITFPIWGRHADSVGNAKVLKTTGLLTPIVPLLWMFTTNPYSLIAIELFSGLVWGGFNLCVTNFIYDAVTPSKRVRCLGYFNLINGVAIFAGAALGGWMSGRLPPLVGSSLVTLFLISAVARLLAVFILGPHFREVREGTRAVSSVQLFFSVVGIRPLIGPTHEFEPLTSKEDASFARRVRRGNGAV